MRISSIGLLAMLWTMFASGCLQPPAGSSSGFGVRCWDGSSPLRGHAWSCCQPYCRWLDECSAEKMARRAARKDLRCMTDSNCITCDYRAGYEQAYVDVALGADGNVPVFPPREYWKDFNRTLEGHTRAEDWFRGYAAGAQQAISIRAPYNFVPASTPAGMASEATW